MTAPRVTLELLRAVGACTWWTERFGERYPTGVDVTVETCVADAGVWPWDTVAEVLLPELGQRLYCPAIVSVTAECTCRNLTDEESARRFAEAALQHGLRTFDSSNATAST